MLASIDANQLRQIEFLQRCFVSEPLDGELADFVAISLRERMNL